MLKVVTRATWETKLGETLRIAEAADALADYMLFVDEAKIPGGIEGSAGYAETFTAQGPKDSKGRSLRELDLKTRLQKYPLSYMIYSPQFDGLPRRVKHAVYARLLAALTATREETRYPEVSAAEKAMTLDILTSTKPDFRDFVQHQRAR